MSMRVLIIEDDATLAKNIARFLTRNGYVPTVTHCITAALSELRANAIDIVLLDVELPDGNGLDAYPDMCRLAPQIRGIFMTGSSRPEHRARAGQLRQCGFLSKPFSLSSLVQYMNRFDDRERCDRASNNN